MLTAAPQRQDLDRATVLTVRTGDMSHVVSYFADVQEHGRLAGPMKDLQAVTGRYVDGLMPFLKTHKVEGIAAEAAKQIDAVQRTSRILQHAIREAEGDLNSYRTTVFDTVPPASPTEAVIRQGIRDRYASMPDDKTRFEAAMRADLSELHALREGSPVLQGDLQSRVIERHRRLNFIDKAIREKQIGPPRPTLDDPAPVGVDMDAANQLADRAFEGIETTAERIKLARRTLSDTVRLVAGVTGKQPEAMLADLLGDGPGSNR